MPETSRKATKTAAAGSIPGKIHKIKNSESKQVIITIAITIWWFGGVVGGVVGNVCVVF